MNRSFVYGVGLSAVAILAACGQSDSQTGTAESAQSSASALSGTSPSTFDVNVVLPAGISLVSTAIGAANALVLGPHDNVTGSLASGNGPVVLFPKATTGTIQAVGSVQLDPRARVEGNVLAGSAVQKAGNATVTGSAQGSANITASTVSWTVSNPSPSQGDIALHDGANAAPSPGAYGNVVADRDSILYLATGTYFLNSLYLENLRDPLVSS